MPLVADPSQKSNLKATLVAAIFLFASRLLRERELEALPRSGSDICRALGVSRSQAYAMRARIEASCAELGDKPGPAPRSAPTEELLPVVTAVRDFALDNPGCVAARGLRRRYSDSFRSFVVGLLRPGQSGEGLTVEQLAQATGVPPGTLKPWLRSEASAEQPAQAPPPPDLEGVPASELTSHPEIATIITEYEQWHGDFTSFCDHLRANLRLPYGRTFVASVLQALGLRSPKRRKQPGYAPWSPDTFRRLFPGAQWLGDGTTLVMQVNGQCFPFTLEAVGDVASNALVGLKVADSEDQQAVLDAFDQGLDTTGGHPLAMTLDNKPCNHTEQVKDAVEPTTVLPATPGRGQAKAPLEGAFGLFAQTAPPLAVEGRTRRELARSILVLVVTLWAWTRNGKPRRRLGGRSPATFYASHRPTPAELTEASSWIDELKRRAERARATTDRRADPVRREHLKQAFVELDIDDPDGRLAIALARYGTEAILRGLAIFKAKSQRDTLPREADPGRYLGGIIRNLDSELELNAMADHLLELRLRHKQLSLAQLERELGTMRSCHPPEDLPFALVRRALDAAPDIDFRFFATQARQALASLPASEETILPHLVRIVAAHFRATKYRRQTLIARLTRAAA